MKLFNATVDTILGGVMVLVTITTILGNALALRVFLRLQKTRANLLFSK